MTLFYLVTPFPSQKGVVFFQGAVVVLLSSILSPPCPGVGHHHGQKSHQQWLPPALGPRAAQSISATAASLARTGDCCADTAPRAQAGICTRTSAPCSPGKPMASCSGGQGDRVLLLGAWQWAETSLP